MFYKEEKGLSIYGGWKVAVLLGIPLQLQIVIDLVPFISLYK